MTKEDMVLYLANVALIAAVDGKLSPLEARQSRVYVKKLEQLNLICIRL